MPVKKKHRGPDPEMMPRPKKRPKPESTGAALARMGPALARTRAARAELELAIAEHPLVELTPAELAAIAPLGSPPAGLTAETFYAHDVVRVGRGRGSVAIDIDALAEEPSDDHPGPSLEPGSGDPMLNFQPDMAPLAPNPNHVELDVSPRVWTRFQRYLDLVGGDAVIVADEILGRTLDDAGAPSVNVSNVIPIPARDPAPGVLVHDTPDHRPFGDTRVVEGRFVQRTAATCRCCKGFCQQPFNWRGIVRCGCQPLATGKTG